MQTRIFKLKNFDIPKKYLLLHLLFKNDSVAQPVEQRPFKPWVLGSNPSGITNESESLL